MGNVLNRKHILLIVIAIVVLPMTWWISAGIRGQLRARYDVKRGHYRILAYGLLGGGSLEYKALLHDRYGIEVKIVAGCIVTPTLVSYADAYNRESVAAAKRKFGHDVFKECSDEATKRWQERHKAELQDVSHSE